MKRGCMPRTKKDSIVEKCFQKYCSDGWFGVFLFYFLKLLNNASLKTQLVILFSSLYFHVCECSLYRQGEQH